MAHLVAYFLVGFIAVGTLLTVAAVGKPRRPLEARTAALVVLISALEISGLVYLVSQL